MSVAQRGARLAAAALAAGLSLGGPLHYGTASADIPGDVESAAPQTAADGDSARKSGASRPFRSGVSAPADGAATARAEGSRQPAAARPAAVAAAPGDAGGSGQPGPLRSLSGGSAGHDAVGGGVADSGAASRPAWRRDRVVEGLGSEVASAALSAGLGAAPPAAATRLGRRAEISLVPRAFALNPPGAAPAALDQAVGGLAAATVGLVDVIRDLLTSLPVNPVSEILSGALWLMRRTLVPLGGDVGQSGSAACVATKDCSGLDLAGADLRRQDLSGVNFRNANLTGADLNGANLNDADLRGAVLAAVSDEDLVSVSWNGANLGGQNLSLRDLRKIDLRNTDLSGILLTRSILIGAKFDGAKLGSAILSGANLSTADFIGADLTAAQLGPVGESGAPELYTAYLVGANFTNANLEKANLAGVNLQDANLTNANLTDAQLRGVKNLNDATLTGASLTRVDLSAASGSSRDLSRKDLTGTNLVGAILAGVNLDKANLTKANLTDAQLRGAVGLASATLTGAFLTRADLRAMDLSGKDLTGVDLGGALLDQALLSGANLRQVYLGEASLVGAKLNSANLDGANLLDANLAYADLTDATMARAVLSSANLTGTNLRGADLSSADLSRAVLTGARLAEAKLADADLGGADLRGAVLAGVSDAELARWNLSGANLSEQDLSGRKLAGIRLTNADLQKANLSGADLSGAKLDGANLFEANLAEANLRDANLKGARLVGATLDGVTNFGTATLTGANLTFQPLIRLDLSGKDLTGTNLAGANLSGTTMVGAKLEQADLSFAKMVGTNLAAAFLKDANLADANLRNAIWRNTTCPDGSKTDSGCSSVASDAESDAGQSNPGYDLLGSDPDIATNPAFSYQDAILAGRFSELAYKWRDAADFAARVNATGWQGIRVSDSAMGQGGFSPAAGGYGVIGFQDGMPVNSYAFAGRRTAADGTEQFVFAVEGSNACSVPCLLDTFGIEALLRREDRYDWNANVQQYGWSRYYASLQPLMAEVLRQMIGLQRSGTKTQLIITGHSLGGATAMVAYADLLAPQGNLYPGSTDVLIDGKRIWDKIPPDVLPSPYSDPVRQAILDATTVYTFGAPSPLMDPVKIPGGLNALLADISLKSVFDIWRTLGEVQTVRDDLLPKPYRDGTANRVFQFEHTGTTFYTRRTDPITGAEVLVERKYADDVVAALGSRDPGYRFEIQLRQDIHEGYAGGSSAAEGTLGLSGATHDIGLYNESLIRLATWNALLADRTPFESVVGSPTTSGQGSDPRNDVFRDIAGTGRGGNDWFGLTKPGDFVVDGGQGNDLYVQARDVAVTIDGYTQVGSGSDGVIFFGPPRESPGEVKVQSEVELYPQSVTVTYSVSGTGPTSSLTIRNWDEWAPSDIFLMNSSDRWYLERVSSPVSVGPVS